MSGSITTSVEVYLSEFDDDQVYAEAQRRRLPIEWLWRLHDELKRGDLDEARWLVRRALLGDYT